MLSVNKSPLLILILLLASFLGVSLGVLQIPAAHAAPITGKVCLTDASAVPSTGSPCPAAPYVFNGPFPSTPQPGPTQLRIGVYISGSNGTNTFDITLLTNSSFLKPAGVDLTADSQVTGSVLNTVTGPSSVLVECVGGALIHGSTCSVSDTPGTIHLAAAAAPGAFVNAPVTGLLFTAIFNIIGTAPAGGFVVGFQTGCVGSSVGGGLCVAIPSGMSNPPFDPETVQTATFDNSAGNAVIAWFYETSNVTSVTVLPGATSGNHVQITVTAPNGLPVLGTASVVLSSAATAGFNSPIFASTSSPTATCSTFTGTPLTCSLVAILSTTMGGTYFVTFYESYIGDNCAGVGPCSTTYTLFGTLTIEVNIQSVGWTINTVPYSSAQTLYMAKGNGITNPMPLLFTVQSLGGYVGTITYSTGLLLQSGQGIKITYPSSLTLSAGQTITSTVNATATSYGTSPVPYTAKLAPTGLTTLTSKVLTIHVAGVSLATNSTSLTIPSGGFGFVSVTAAGLPASSSGFAGTVTISTTVTNSTGQTNLLVVSCPSTLSIAAAGGSATGNCSLTGTKAGTYSVAINATAGTNNDITNSTVVTVTVRGPPDFTISAAPKVVTAVVGSLGNSTISVSPLSGFSGTVTLAVKTNSTNLSCTFSPSTIPSASGSSTLSCTSSVVANYLVNVTGTSGSISHSVVLTFHITPPPDFTISANPTAVKTNTGVPGNSTISISSLNGFTSAVTLAVTTNSPNLSCTLSSTSITGGSGSSTLSCTSSIAASYIANVTGTSGSLVHFVIVGVSVVIFPFQLVSTPSSVAVNAGSLANSTITVKSLNGFTGTISLSSSSSSASLSCSLAPTNIVLGTSGNSTLSCGGPPGVYTVTVSGTNGTLTSSVRVTVEIQDFRINASPASVTVNAGSIGASSISVTGLGGFAGVVSLATNSTSCVSLNSVTGSGSVTLSCTFASARTVVVAITGTSGALSHSTTVTFTVQDFTITPGSTSVIVNVGSAGTSSITVAALNGFAGTVSFVSNSTSCTVSPSTVTGSGNTMLSCTFSSASTVFVTVTGTNQNLVHSATVTYTVQDFTIAATSISVTALVNATATSTITVTALNGFTGTVGLSDTVASTNGLTCTLSQSSLPGSGTSVLSCKASTAGTSTVTITGKNGALSHSADVTVSVVDFFITLSQPLMTVSEGSAASTTITIASVNGFSGSISLTPVVVKPLTGFAGTALPTVSLSSFTVTLTSSTTSVDVLVTVTVGNDVYPQGFGVEVNATTGSGAELLFHVSSAISLTVPPPGFKIASSSASIIIGPGGSGSATLRLTSQGGQFGPVSLSLSYSASGATCSLGLSGLNLSAGGSNSTALSCSGQIGSYTVTVTGAFTTPYGVKTQLSGSIRFVVADFSISSTPISILVNAGQTGHAQISISWPDNYNGTVTLQLAPVSGLNASLSSSTITGSKTTTLNVISNTGAVYSLVITATSGSSSHTETLTVTVMGAAPTSTIFGLDPAVFYSGVGVLVAVAAAGILLLRRRK